MSSVCTPSLGCPLWADVGGSPGQLPSTAPFASCFALETADEQGCGSDWSQRVCVGCYNDAVEDQKVKRHVYRGIPARDVLEENKDSIGHWTGPVHFTIWQNYGYILHMS